MQQFQACVEPFIALLFPDRCAACGATGSLFCASCGGTLSPYAPERDLQLANVSAHAIAFTFEGPLRAAVHQLKYRRRRRVAVPLGELMAAHLARQLFAYDGLLAVPMHAERLAERGFNQAQELAHVVARSAAVPVLDGLARVRATAQQAKLSALDRRTNMQGAFVWRHTQPPPRRVLLVDDVLTTGATVNACASALLAAGAQSVYALALARSRDSALPPANSRRSSRESQSEPDG